MEAYLVRSGGCSQHQLDRMPAGKQTWLLLMLHALQRMLLTNLSVFPGGHAVPPAGSKLNMPPPCHRVTWFGCESIQLQRAMLAAAMVP